MAARHKTNLEWAENARRYTNNCTAQDILTALQEGDVAKYDSRSETTAQLLNIGNQEAHELRKLWANRKRAAARQLDMQAGNVSAGGNDSPLLGRDLQEFQNMAAHAQKLLDKKARLEEELAAVEKYLVTYEPILQQVKNMREATRKAKEASQP